MKCRNYGHRGCSGKYPENTLLSFEKALEAGCEGIEFDVQLTRDGVIVILHDEAIDRTSDGSGLVRDMTYAELQKINFAYPKRFGEQFGFQHILTLQEYFALVKGRDIISNIELKTGVFTYPGIEKAVYEQIRAAQMESHVIVSSFNHHSVLRMKELDPNIRCGFLSETWILDAGSYVKQHGVEAYHPRHNMLLAEELADLKQHNVEINTWTVNEPEDIQNMIEAEVDGIISNFPDRVGQALREAGLR